MRNPARSFRFLFLSIGVALFSVPGFGQDDDAMMGNDSFNDRFKIALGGFFPSVNSSVSVKATDGSGGGAINMEGDLNLADATETFYVLGMWRMWPRHALAFEYFELNRSGFTASVTDPIESGDNTVLAGASVASELDLAIARLTYGYSLIRDERKELGLHAGLHFAELKTAFKLSGNILVNGMPVFQDPLTPKDERRSAAFPLPHLGGSFAYAFTPKFSGSVSIFGFALDIGDIDGALLEINGFLRYQIWDNFGVAAGIKFFDVEVTDKKKSDRHTSYSFDFIGPAVAATFNF